MALVAGPLTNPLIAGDVAVGGDIDWKLIAGDSVDQNSRRMLDGAFDVAEMSFSTFVKAREIGKDLIGLPIFTGRGFLQPGLVVSTASGIKHPEELAGKRVGVPQFWMTSTVWHRLILQRRHNVPEEAITWYTAADERFAEVPRSPGVTIHRLAGETSISEALAEGKVDATMVPPRGAPKGIGGAIQWPYPDIKKAESDYYADTGIFPIMHFVVLKESVHNEFPWLADALMTAFVETKKHAVAAGEVDADMWAYGLSENAKPLDAFLSFAAEKQWVAPARTTADFFVRN